MVIDPADAHLAAVDLLPRMVQLERWARDGGLTADQQAELLRHEASIAELRSCVDGLGDTDDLRTREWHAHLRRHVAELTSLAADARHWTSPSQGSHEAPPFAMLGP